MFFKGVEKGACKAEVPLHKVFRVLGAVNAGEIEDKVRLLAISVEKLRIGVKIVLVDLIYFERGASPVFAVAYALKAFNKILADKALSSGYENIQYLSPFLSSS